MARAKPTPCGHRRVYAQPGDRMYRLGSWVKIAGVCECGASVELLMLLSVWPETPTPSSTPSETGNPPGENPKAGG